MKVSDNKTVADIVNETKSAIDYGNGVLLDLAGKQAIGILDRIEAAHKREMNHRALIAGVSLADAVDDAHKRELAAKDAEIAELRELLIELANAANTAFDDIAKCGSIIADGDVRDAAYRTHLMERIAKYRKALKGGHQ